MANSAKRSQKLGLGASAAAAALWGLGGIFAALASAPGLVVTFYRLWLGAVLLSIMIFGSGRRLTWSMLRATWLGGVLLACDLVMFYSAVKLTSIVDATVIGAFQPALVLVAARRLFSERMSRWDVAWIFLAMVGAAVAIIGPGKSSHHQVIGDLLAVGALLSFSAYWLVTKKARQMRDAMEYTAGVTIVAAAAVTPVVLLSSQSLGSVKLGDWFWIFLLTVVPGSGHLLMNWAHRYVDASVSSAISCLSPLVAGVAAIPILGQTLTALQVVGALIGLTAIAVVAARHHEPAQPLTE
ncbi:MAG TPA: DMT family transporter [Acidimicrobiales bacterium]|nr:DMT family transporter [Acidimicrobiales bacterium]